MMLVSVAISRSIGSASRSTAAERTAYAPRDISVGFRTVKPLLEVVTDAAISVDSLVSAITEVNGQMAENSEVAKNLKEESSNFVNV